jgi:hypothetical protein
MSWERRKNRTYYYRWRRENGRRVRQYVGSGEDAEIAARMDAQMAGERLEARAKRLRTQAELEELAVELDRYDRDVSALVSAAMAVAGFHYHRGHWRKRRETVNAPDTTPPADAPAPEPPETFQELVARARRGDPDALARVRPRLSERQFIESYGNVARRALELAIQKMVGIDFVAGDSICRKLEALRAEIGGSDPGPLEKLVVDRVVAQWLHLHQLEVEFATAGDHDPARAGYYQSAIAAAQDRFFRAIRELTRVRRDALPALGAKR